MHRIRIALFFAAAWAAFPFAAQADPLCGLVVGPQNTSVLPEVRAEWARATLYWNGFSGVLDAATEPAGFADVDRIVANSPNTLVSVEAFARDLQSNGDAYSAACYPRDWQHVLERWRAFWQVATSRYCASNPARSGVVRYWSVWNEPNAWNFLHPRLECSQGYRYCDPDHPDHASRKSACQASAAQDYIDLVRYAEMGRQAGCPSATLVVGEIAQHPDQLAFTNQVLSGVKSHGINPGVLSVHTYDTAAGVVNQVAAYRNVLNNHQPGAEIWMTEAGGPAPGLPVATCSANGWNPQDPSCWGAQASFLRDMFRLNRQYAAAYNWPRTFIYRAQVLYMPKDEYGIALVNGNGQVTRTLSTQAMRDACTCGEASCVPAQGAYVSHYSGPGCTGTESYYLPYDGWAYQCRTWNGSGSCGTVRRRVTNYSYRSSDGQCRDEWRDGNTLDDFVTVYR